MCFIQTIYPQVIYLDFIFKIMRNFDNLALFLPYLLWEYVLCLVHHTKHSIKLDNLRIALTLVFHILRIKKRDVDFSTSLVQSIDLEFIILHRLSNGFELGIFLTFVRFANKNLFARAIKPVNKSL